MPTIKVIAKVRGAFKKAIPKRTPMDLFLVTDYPTMSDPNTQYAFGLVVATNLNQAKKQVLELLKSQGLEIGPNETSEVTAVQIDTALPGIALFFG